MHINGNNKLIKLHQMGLNITFEVYLILMNAIVDVIAANIRRLRELKSLSQKEVSAQSGVPQGQYSRIENGRVEPAVSTLDKLAKVFEVSVSEFFRSDDVNEQLNLPLMEKVKLIDTLGEEEKQALFKMIDLAISNKKMKDSLSNILTA